MKQILRLPLFLVVLIIFSCKSTRTGSSAKDNGKLEVDFVQVNDVYEIAPLENGKSGGLARIATIKQEWLKKNPNTLLVMAGDFVSPSVFNSLKYRDTAIRGRQMIESMNAAGFDMVIFGNHEFDIKENELQLRMNESDFLWVSSNAFHKVKEGVLPFYQIKAGIASPLPVTYIRTFKDADGTSVKIGFIGIVLPFNQAPYVSYTDPQSAAVEMYNRLKDSCDAVVAITHQLVEDDKKLAAALPGLAMIIGGHEHNGQFEKVGNVYITKALANAKSAYVLKLKINKRKKRNKVIPILEMLDEKVALDPATNSVVQHWVDIANASYKAIGFDAEAVLIEKCEPLEGRETYVRSGSTNLTQLVVHAMEESCPLADLAITNSGSIRVDDIVYAPVKEYDILRSLPYGGAIREVEMTGELLIKTLDIGKKNVGSGGFLQYSSFISYNSNNHQWLLKNNPIDPGKTYRVAIADFLISGLEANLGFLKPGPGITEIKYEPVKDDPRSDVRLAIIQYVKKRNGKLD